LTGARHSGLREEVSAAAMEPRRAQTDVDDIRLTVQSRPVGYRSLVWPATAIVGRWSGVAMRLPAPPRSRRRVTPSFALVVPKARSDLAKMIRGIDDVKRLGCPVFRMDNNRSTRTRKSIRPIICDLLRAYRHGIPFCLLRDLGHGQPASAGWQGRHCRWRLSSAMCRAA